MKRLLLFSFAFLSWSTTACAQVRPLGLQEIVKSAATSFIGTVSGVRYGYDANQDIVTYTTFHVDQAITGNPESTVTIKQIGGIMNRLDTRIAHIRYFRKGERVLVSMYPNSQLGFSNPVGLDQGVWPVTKSGMVLNVTQKQLEGLATVLPDYGISSTAAAQTAPQSISVSHFASLMQALAADRVSSGRGGLER